MAPEPSAHSHEECFGGLAEQDDAEFEPYQAGISAEAVDAAYRLLAPSSKVGPPARSPMCASLRLPHFLYLLFLLYVLPHLLYLPLLLYVARGDGTALATCYT